MIIIKNEMRHIIQLDIRVKVYVFITRLDETRAKFNVIYVFRLGVDNFMNLHFSKYFVLTIFLLS